MRRIRILLSVKRALTSIGLFAVAGCLVIENGPADTTATGEPASVAAAAAAAAARDTIAGRVASSGPELGVKTPAGTHATANGAVGKPIDTLSALGDVAATPGNASGRATDDVTKIGPLAPPTAADIDALKGELGMPIASIAPSQLFDSFDEKRGTSRRHEAIDIPAPRRTPVVSAAPGRVMRLYSSKDGGLMIYAADATERFILMYAHLDGYAPGLADGATLVRGQTIGFVGTTGNAPPNLPHLHFAIARTPNVARWWTGVPVNPYPLLHRP